METLTLPPARTERPMNRLRELREARGMTQTQLAQATGIGQTVISMFETSGRKLGWKRLQILSEYFDVDPRYLAGRKNLP
jgi:transcriptional regulator with XRE-family HTH domain